MGRLNESSPQDPSVTLPLPELLKNTCPLINWWSCANFLDFR
jgi:hypothetical protein